MLFSRNLASFAFRNCNYSSFLCQSICKRELSSRNECCKNNVCCCVTLSNQMQISLCWNFTTTTAAAATSTLLAAAGNVIHIFSFQVNSQFPNIALKCVQCTYIHIVKLFVRQPFSHSSAELSIDFIHFMFYWAWVLILNIIYVLVFLASSSFSILC